MQEIEGILREESIETLDSVMSNYKFILLDNSALDSLGLSKDIKLKQSHYKHEFYKDGNEFMTFLFENFNILNLYLPLLMFKEIQSAADHHFPYKEIIKKTGGKINRIRLENYRLIRDTNKKRNQLLDRLGNEERIISFNGAEKELYKGLYEDYLNIKEYYDLSDPDFDFLISGAVFSLEKGTTALLSNDFPIFYAWKKILRERKITGEQFGFFLRKNFPYVEKLS